MKYRLFEAAEEESLNSRLKLHELWLLPAMGPGLRRVIQEAVENDREGAVRFLNCWQTNS